MSYECIESYLVGIIGPKAHKLAKLTVFCRITY